MPRLSPARKAGAGRRSALKGIMTSASRPSPTIPPIPVQNGHEAGTGKADSMAARTGMKAAPNSQRRKRGVPISTARIAPPIIRQSPAIQAAKPKVCSARSAMMAPVGPKRLATSSPLAAFRLGSVGWCVPTLPQRSTPKAKAAVPVRMRQAGSETSRWAPVFVSAVVEAMRGKVHQLSGSFPEIGRRALTHSKRRETQLQSANAMCGRHRTKKSPASCLAGEVWEETLRKKRGIQPQPNSG